MKLMLLAEIDTPTGNKIIGEGKMGQVLQGVIDALKPEASYFYARNGRRAFTLIVDVPDVSHVPAVAEPLWLEFGASVEVIPVMTGDELEVALSRMG